MANLGNNMNIGYLFIGLLSLIILCFLIYVWLKVIAKRNDTAKESAGWLYAFLIVITVVVGFVTITSLSDVV